MKKLVLLTLVLLLIACKDDSTFPNDASASRAFETITLQPGSDATEVNFNWYSNKDGKKSLVRISDNVIAGTSEVVSETKLRHRVTVKGLKQGTSYKYKISNDSVNWSVAYNYKTVPTGKFKFAVVGDPQVSMGMQDPASVFADKTTAEGWATTVNKIVSEGAYFIISAGDHVDNVEGNEAEYDNLFAPAALRNIPLAPTIGNHDTHCLFAYHFNLPNEQNSKPLVCSSTGGTWSEANSDLGNYYYAYNRVLFIALNTTPYPNASSAVNYISAFDATIKAAKAANAGKYDWIIVHHHKSTRSAAIHATDGDIKAYMDAGFENLMETHGVNLVFAGHDHIFVRSQDENGPVYMTLTASGGLKYYPASDIPANTQKYNDDFLPEYTIVEVNDKTITVTTKKITGEVVDNFAIFPKR